MMDCWEPAKLLGTLQLILSRTSAYKTDQSHVASAAEKPHTMSVT